MFISILNLQNAYFQTKVLGLGFNYRNKFESISVNLLLAQAALMR